MGSNNSKKAQKSIQALKIRQFFTYYGFKHGPEIFDWLSMMYSPDFTGSTTLNFTTTKTIDGRRNDLPTVYERAFKGQYRPRNIQFNKVDQDARIIYYTWTNNTPHATDPSRRVDIPFESYVVFDEDYRILRAVHIHKPIEKKLSRQVGRQVKSLGARYLKGVLQRAHDNMGTVNQILSQNYYPDTTATNQQYEASQRQFRQNRNKEAREWNNWVNSQKNRGY